MSMGIMVEEFKYVRGVNDSEYIELLKNAYERQKYITSKAIAKLKEQPKIIRCKNCLHWQHSEIHPNYCEVWNWCNTAEDFCSFAERRNNVS